MTFDIGLCQMTFDSAETVDDLTARISDAVDQAGPADLYVMPELLGAGPMYDPDVPATDRPLPEDAAQQLHDHLADVAAVANAVVVGGSYLARGPEHSILNRCPVATPDEVVTYDKRNLIPDERSYGTRPGDEDPPVVTHDGVSVAPLICYDVEFPELVRSVVDRGAEVLAVPSWTETPAGAERVRRCAAARAVENQCYVAQVPLVNEPDGEPAGTGRSAVFAPCDDVCGSGGTRLVLPRDQRVSATCPVDIDELRRSRAEGSVRPFEDYRKNY